MSSDWRWGGGGGWSRIELEGKDRELIIGDYALMILDTRFIAQMIHCTDDFRHPVALRLLSRTVGSLRERFFALISDTHFIMPGANACFASNSTCRWCRCLIANCILSRLRLNKLARSLGARFELEWHACLLIYQLYTML